MKNIDITIAIILDRMKYLVKIKAKGPKNIRGKSENKCIPKTPIKKYEYRKKIDKDEFKAGEKKELFNVCPEIKVSRLSG